jgi:4-amino-4-deoxy-L-arabinose transferase-like glycosyltransferase
MVLVLVVVAAARLRLLNFPLERDEGEYAYAGQLMLQGIPPYQLACNMKFPGTYAAYVVIMAIFGQSPAGIHFGVLCLTMLTALMLFWLGKQLLDWTAGMVAATFYAVMAASPTMFGLAGHATHFAAFFATAGLCTLWQARQNGKWPVLVASGILFGLTVMMKQHGAVIALWAAFAFTVMTFRRTDITPVRRLATTAIFGLAMVLPFALCCLSLWYVGVFDKFWFWTIDYAREFASEVSVSQAPGMLWYGLRYSMVNGFLLLPFAAAGAVSIWYDARLAKSRAWLFGFGLASVLSVFPDFYFLNHYFLLMLPGIALLAGIAVSGGFGVRGQKIADARRWDWPVWIYVLAAFITILTCADLWFRQTPTQASRTIYAANPFPEAEEVARFIRTNSPPSAPMAVLGSEPELYFLSHRHSVTGYIYTYGMMEPQPFARRMQDEMIHDIETTKPGYIIFVADRLSWWPYPDSDLTIFKWWNTYQSNYTLVAIADVVSPTNTIYAFGEEMVKRYGTAHGSALEVFQRKPAGNAH